MLEKKAIERFKAFEPEDGYYLAYSGGKDSDCIKILAQLAGVKFEAVHNLTTVDAPETVNYIKSQSDVRIDYPQKSMWRLIKEKLLPPTRISRYCCSELKEKGGKGKIKVTGVRWAESVKRSQSSDVVKVIGKPKTMQKTAADMGVEFTVTKQNGLIMNDDNDINRRFVEHCYRTTTTILNPIVDWTDNNALWILIGIIVNLFIGMYNGKRRYKSFTANTKKEAEFKAAEFNIKRNEYTPENITLHNAIEFYIESKRNILSPSTVRGYYTVLKNYCQNLMYKRVSEITRFDLQISINDMAAKYSPKSCRNAHGLISAVLKMYRPDFILTTTLPRKHKREIYVPDNSEVEHLYKLSFGTSNEIPIFLAAECGLRASEIGALTVENVTPTHIFIKQALVIGDDNIHHLKEPKSDSGYRKVPISKDVYDYLVANAAENGRICNKKTALICNSFTKFRDRNHLDKNLTFHALRHHYASKCILLGIPQKYIAELMGHSSTEMIEKVYQHIFPSAMEAYSHMLRAQMSELCNTKNGL